MSDPYNPLERQLCLTRHALELLAAFGFGVAIDTKSGLVARTAMSSPRWLPPCRCW